MSSRTEVELPGGFKLKGGVVGVIFILVIVFGFWWMQKHEDLVPVQAANDALRARLAETAKHIGEELKNQTTLYEGDLGRIAIGVYRDRCVALIATAADGHLLLTQLVTDMLKDSSLHTGILQALQPILLAAGGGTDSRCDYINHGPLARQPYEESRQGVNVLIRYDFTDGCAFRQWVDTYHGTQGPRQWIVCRH